jgi:hypothetical protein
MKLILSKITMQILFSTLLTIAMHPTLKNSKETFCRVRMNVTTCVFLRARLHYLMPSEVRIHGGVKAAFIRV